MISVNITKVDPERVGRLRDWMTEARSRADEVRATFADEGVRHERALLVDTSDGPLLVYVVECEDYDAAVEVFARSTHPVDVEHKKVMSETRGEPVPAEVLFDLRA